MSAEHDQVENVSVLISAGADVHAVDEAQETALHWAALYGKFDVAITVLLQFGANVHAVDKYNRAPHTHTHTHLYAVLYAHVVQDDATW